MYTLAIRANNEKNTLKSSEILAILGEDCDGIFVTYDMNGDEYADLITQKALDRVRNSLKEREDEELEIPDLIEIFDIGDPSYAGEYIQMVSFESGSGAIRHQRGSDCSSDYLLEIYGDVDESTEETELKQSILPLSDTAKLKMANHIIEAIDEHETNLGVSNDINEEDGGQSVHIDTENMNEACCLDTVVSEAIKAACEEDCIECGID